MNYTNKIVNKELNGEILKATKLKPLTISRAGFKLMQALAPSLGLLADAMSKNDSDLVFTSAFTLINQNLTLDEMQDLQVLLLGSILDSESVNLETPANIDTYFEDKPEIMIDVLYWLFTENLMPYIEGSKLISDNMSKITSVIDKVKGIVVPVSEKKKGKPRAKKTTQ